MGLNKIICTICPKGCSINVEADNGQITGISGYACKRGMDYALTECINPVRTLTTTVKVRGGVHPVLSVKSEKPVPKELLLKCVNEINKYTIEAPVRIGDIIIPDILGTGISIKATGNMGKAVQKSF